MTNEELIEFCKSKGACDDALYWLKDTGYDFETAWEECDVGAWLGWLVQKVKVNKRKRVLCAALCANQVRSLTKDERIIEAVDVALKYGRGEATDDELTRAAAAAYAAARAYSADAAAAYAASDAADAAYSAAADAAADAAAYAADAVAEATAEADGLDAAYDRYVQIAQKTAEIFRENISVEELKTNLK